MALDEKVTQLYGQIVWSGYKYPFITLKQRPMRMNYCNYLPPLDNLKPIILKITYLTPLYPSPPSQTPPKPRLLPQTPLPPT